MALTRDFKETIRARVARDPKYRKELLREGVECMLSGDIATAKTILRDYINATVGFTEVAEATHIPSKSRCGCSDLPAIPEPTIFSRWSASCSSAKACVSTGPRHGSLGKVRASKITARTPTRLVAHRFSRVPLSCRPHTAGRRHFSRRRLLSMTDFGSPTPPDDIPWRGSHPKIL